MRRLPVLADALDGRDNNLNAIRMLAAIAVLVSHAWAITRNQPDPVFALTRQTLGQYAVAVFFGVSGLLIARSFDGRRSIGQFVIARVLRLYPALLVVLILTVIAGSALSELGPLRYLSSLATWRYIPANLSLAVMQYDLPGVFSENPYGPAINGSLWTLFYEVVCYGGVVVLGLAGLLRRREAMLAVTIAASAVHYTWPAIAASGIFAGLTERFGLLAMLGFPFMLGTCAYVWRAQLPLSGAIAALLWLPVVLFGGAGAMDALITLALVYGALWLGFAPKGALLAYNRLGDYSYGVYIYAFPVQQFLVWWRPGMGVVENIALALPPTLAFGVLSWHLVEERALALVRRASGAGCKERQQLGIRG